MIVFFEQIDIVNIIQSSAQFELLNPLDIEQITTTEIYWQPDGTFHFDKYDK